MSKHKNKMICPKCRAEMNHHADKLVDPITPDDRKHFNPDLGGVVKEMHYCPACGGVESREA
jgi:ribosomal protein S27AE